MHRTNGDSKGTGVGKYDGSIDVYRDENPGSYDATQLRAEEMNAIQEEIANVIRGEGISLQTEAETFAQMFQLETAINTKLAANRITNTSSVPGGAVDDALDNLDAKIDALDSDDIANVSAVSGALVSDALDQLDSDIGALDTYDIADSVGVGPLLSDTIDDHESRLLTVEDTFSSLWYHGLLTGHSLYVDPASTRRVYFPSKGQATTLQSGDRGVMRRDSATSFYKSINASGSGSSFDNWTLGSAGGGVASAVPALKTSSWSGTATSGSNQIDSIAGGTSALQVGDMLYSGSSLRFPVDYLVVQEIVDSDSIKVHVNATSSGTDSFRIEYRPLYAFVLGDSTERGVFEYGFDNVANAANLLADTAGDGYDLHRLLGQILIINKATTFEVANMTLDSKGTAIFTEDLKFTNLLEFSVETFFPIPLRVDETAARYQRALYADIQLNAIATSSSGSGSIFVRGIPGGVAADRNIGLGWNAGYTYGAYPRDKVECRFPMYYAFPGIVAEPSGVSGNFSFHARLLGYHFDREHIDF